jgi:long-chain fatty acid transport protein
MEYAFSAIGRRFDVRATNRRIIVCAATVLLLPSLTWGAGFALFEHGNRGMAMGGAFTAVADDPSAFYWNPAGLAFQNEEGVQVMDGVTFILPSQDFYGDSPYPGDGYTAEQESQTFYPPHLYLIYPMNEKMAVSLGVMTPFGLGTWWEEDFAGRFISKRVDLRLIDIGATFSYRVSDRLAIGLGVDYGIGSLDYTKNAGLINPYTQRVEDVASAHIYTEGLDATGYGWNASFLAKLGGGFTLGGLYRSNIDVDVDGEASFTQDYTGYADFDAAVAAMIPFDENVPITSGLDFPEFWSIGLAWTNETYTVSASYCGMGWSSVQGLTIDFTQNPELNTVVNLGYEDTNTVRVGFEYRVNESWAVQAGYLEDETPQPIEAMSPLLGDGDRTGYSAGVSWSGEKFGVDFGYMRLPIDDRSTEGRQQEGYNGRYDGEADLIGISLRAKF